MGVDTISFVLTALATTAIAVLAWVAWWAERRRSRERRRAVDARISAVSYALQRQLLSWVTDVPKHPAHPDRNAFEAIEVTPWASEEDPKPPDEKEYTDYLMPALQWIGERQKGHFDAAEARFQRLVADAPEASTPVAESIRRAYVLFYRATARWNREAIVLRRGGRLPHAGEMVRAYRELRWCAELLDPAIGEELRGVERKDAQKNAGIGTVGDRSAD